MIDEIFDMIILGAGPAGIATAYEAEILGLKKNTYFGKNSFTFFNYKKFL